MSAILQDTPLVNPFKWISTIFAPTGQSSLSEVTDELSRASLWAALGLFLSRLPSVVRSKMQSGGKEVLDGEFACRMDQQTIDSEAIEKIERSSVIRSNRILLIAFCKMSYFDIGNGNDDNDNAPAQAKQTRSPPRSGQGLKLPSLAHLMSCIYLLCILGLCLSYFNQQRYDYYLFHRRQLLEASANRNRTGLAAYGSDLARARRQLDERIEASRRRLEQVGAPLLEGSYAGQYFLLTWLLGSYLTYFNSLVFRRWLRRIDPFFVGATLNYEARQLKMNVAIRDEVNAFIRSSENFTRNSRSRRRLQFRARRASHCHSAATRRRWIGEDQSDSESLRSMILSGRLRLISRSPEQMITLSRYYLVGNLFLQISSALSISVLLLLLALWRRQLGMDSLSLPDWLVLIELVFVMTITFFAAISHTFLLYIIWLDQMQLIKQLERIILRSIKTCELSLECLDDDIDCNDDDDDFRGQWVPPSARWPRGIRLELNEQLLEVLLNYRLFVRQLDKVQIHFNYVGLVTIFLMFVTPIMSSIHSPYVSERVRLVMMAWSAYCLVCTLPTIWVVCYHNERCLGLFKSLARLLGHVVELTSSTRELYSQHTLWALRQELANPDLARRRLAPCIFLVAFNYTNLIRALFWYGLIVLTIVMESRGANTNLLLSDLFSDPLGVFRVNFL